MVFYNSIWFFVVSHPNLRLFVMSMNAGTANWCRVEGAGFEGYGSGFRVQGSGFWVG